MRLDPRAAARHTRQQVTARPIDTPFQWGVVHAVHASPNTVDCYLDGSADLTTGLRYLSTYTPVVNDVVLVLRMPGGVGPVGRSRTMRVVVGKLG